MRCVLSCRVLLPLSRVGAAQLCVWIHRLGRPLWTGAQHQAAALQRGLQVGAETPPVHSQCPPAAHGGTCVLRHPSSCHHPLQEEHRCHPGPCPPCRQPCLLPLPGCSHTCPHSCHDQVLVRPQQVRRFCVRVSSVRWGSVPPGQPSGCEVLSLFLSPQLNLDWLPVSCLGCVFLGAASWSVGAAVHTSVCEDSSALSALSSPHSNVGPQHSPTNAAAHTPG